MEGWPCGVSVWYFWFLFLFFSKKDHMRPFFLHFIKKFWTLINFSLLILKTVLSTKSIPVQNCSILVSAAKWQKSDVQSTEVNGGLPHRLNKLYIFRSFTFSNQSHKSWEIGCNFPGEFKTRILGMNLSVKAPGSAWRSPRMSERYIGGAFGYLFFFDFFFLILLVIAINTLRLFSTSFFSCSATCFVDEWFMLTGQKYAMI